MRLVRLLVAMLLTAACGSDVAMGDQGLQGARGFAGPRGEKGEVGPAGPSGSEGPMGERGPMGLQGPPGKDGLSYRPSGYAFCELLLDLIGVGGGLGTDGITETRLQYDFTRYTNDDLEVNCEGALGSEAASSGGFFYPSIAPGAGSGVCLVSVDYPPFTQTPGKVGVWQFEFTGGPLRATYTDSDPGHPLHGRAFLMGEKDCSSFQMSASGAWTSAALNDLL